MKKIFSLIVVMLMTVCMVNAQNVPTTNYAGSSRFTDNWSVSLQDGVVTPFNDFFENGSTTPIVVLGVDKYINPWLGVGVEGRTSIGTGDSYNPHTAFDAVNVSGAVKFNVFNLFNYNGTRRTFEPVAYASLGWGHTNCSEALDAYETTGMVGMVPGIHGSQNSRNYMTFRSGLELNFNLGESKAWGIVVNPSVVWGDICNGRLDKRNGNFEVTAGIVYHFKTSNGTHTIADVDMVGVNEKINALLAENEALKNRKPEVIVKEVIKERVSEKTVESTITVPFEQNSAELTAAAKAILDKVPEGASVDVFGSTSPEGTSARNEELATQRANAAADYLKSRGVNISTVKGNESGRIAVVTIK